MTRAKRNSNHRFNLRELVRIIGYQLTAYIGLTNVWEVREWLKHGLPSRLEERMQAALDTAKPIAEVESELVAQAYLWGNLEAAPTLESPATLLRDATDIPAARAGMEMVTKEFLLNVADDLEDVERRLQEWISRAKMPSGTAYKVGITWDSLWLKLLHAGFPLEQQRSWDRGEDWPLWEQLIAAVPEIATSRTAPNIDTGCPYRCLRRARK
jgi:hypothetical protein